MIRAKQIRFDNVKTNAIVFTSMCIYYMYIYIYIYITCLVGFMYSADADGRGHFLILYFFWHTQSPTAWVTHPPPPMHHDPMKIY